MKLLKLQPETKQNIFHVWRFGNSGFDGNGIHTGRMITIRIVWLSEINKYIEWGEESLYIIAINTDLGLAQKISIGCLSFTWVHRLLYFLSSINEGADGDWIED